MLQRIRDKWTVEMGSSVDIQRIPHRILLERNLVPLREKLIPRACFLSSLSFRYGRCWSPRLGGGAVSEFCRCPGSVLCPSLGVSHSSWLLEAAQDTGVLQRRRRTHGPMESHRLADIPPWMLFWPLWSSVKTRTQECPARWAVTCLTAGRFSIQDGLLKNPPVLGTKGFTGVGKTWQRRQRRAGVVLREVWAPRVADTVRIKRAGRSWLQS